MIKKISVFGLLAICAFVYSFSLDKIPTYLNQDELGFSLNAYSIAQTGFDENGRFFPLYFWHLGIMWSTPIIVYLTAFFLKFLPLSEIVIRLPVVLVGLLDIILVFFVARKIFKSDKYALIAAGFLAIIPVHFMQSRILLDNLFIVPFLLGWLLLLLYFAENKNPWILFLTGLVLGFGIHSYHAAKVMMPLYLLFTLIFIFPEVKRKKWLVFILIFGFILPVLPLIPWLNQYPDTLTDQVRYTGLYNTNLNPLQGLATLLTPEIISQRLRIYWQYFDPLFLFFQGDISLIHSTQKVGAFLFPFMFLLPVGLFHLLKNRNKINLLIITGFFTAPFAPVLVGNEYRISKELVILPFAVLIATAGLQFLFNSKLKIGKWIAIILLIISVGQFGLFLSDYFTDYRVRSYNWFNYNIPGALESAINHDSFVYLDNGVSFIDRYWKFYLIKHNREDLLIQTNYFDPLTTDPQSFPDNSLSVYRFDHINYINSNILKTNEYILEPDGIISFYIYEK